MANVWLKMKKIYYFLIGIVIVMLAFFAIFIFCKDNVDEQKQNDSSETQAEVKGVSTQDEKEQIIQRVSVQEARQIIEGGGFKDNFFILDLRTAEEYQQGHIEGAVNVDYHTTLMQDIPDMDKNATYLIYCQSSARSSQALELFRQQGYYEVYELEGGYNNWQS